MKGVTFNSAIEQRLCGRICRPRPRQHSLDPRARHGVSLLTGRGEGRIAVHPASQQAAAAVIAFELARSVRQHRHCATALMALRRRHARHRKWSWNWTPAMPAALSLSPANDSDDDNEMEMCARRPLLLHGGDIEQTKQRNHQRRLSTLLLFCGKTCECSPTVHAAFFPKPPILPPFPINPS